MAKRIVWTGIILLLLLIGTNTYALSLNETALKILKDGPGWESQEKSLESVFHNLNVTTNLPDPEVGGEYLIAPVSEDNRWAAELTWGLEWPGVYNARIQEAKKKFSSAERAVYAERVEKLAGIKDLLLDYILCKQKLKLLEELNQNNDSIYRLSEQAARGGEMTVLDLNKVRLEYANIRVTKAALLDEEAGIEGELSQIYGKDCTPLLEDMDMEFPEIVIPSEEVITSIGAGAPGVQLANAEVEAARQMQKVAKMESLPSLSVGYKHAYEEGTHFNGALIGISLPFLSSKGKKKAAKAEIIEAEFKAEVAQLEVETDASQAFRKLVLINRQIAEIEPILKNSDHNTLLLKAYSGGVITLLDYLSERNYFTTAEMEMVALRHAAAKTQARLQKYLEAGF